MSSSDREISDRCSQFLPNWCRFSCARLPFATLLVVSSFTVVLLFGSTAGATEDPTAIPDKTSSSDSEAESPSLNRQTLKGSTQHIEYKLADMESYRKGMSALERKNFAAGENFFKAAAAHLGEGYEKYRGECLFFQAKCLAMSGKAEQAVKLYKMAAKLFDQYDPKNPYKGIAIIQADNLASGKARFDTSNLHGGDSVHHARVAVDQRISLLNGATKCDAGKFLLKVDKESISKTVLNCFAEMTCLETAEIGSNVNNAVGRWQPLLVEEDPAALALGASNPQISVRMNGNLYKIALPTFSGMKRILLATDGEQICAMDLDSNDSWLLRLKKNPDGSLNTAQWAKLAHLKTKIDHGVAVTAPKEVWDAKEASVHEWNSKTSSKTNKTRKNSGKTSKPYGWDSNTSNFGGFLGTDNARHFRSRGGTSGSRRNSGF
ncbi:MAG TPA: hypothetical protein PKZ32_14665 [Candidatus Melainabacteria bacterium]|nr:hypothetical protein [Candidatus Melainabacteria bacterium]